MADYKFHTFDDQILAFHREYEGQSILVLINLSREIQKGECKQNFMGIYQELVYAKPSPSTEGFEMKALEFLILK